MQEISIQEIHEWFRQETESFLVPLRKDGEKLVADIKSKLLDVQEVCKAIMRESEEEVKAGEKPRKARAMYKLARYFLQLTENVSLPTQMSFTGLEELKSDLEKVLNLIARQRAIWYPLISPLFIISRRRLDVALEKLMNASKELRVLLSEKHSKAKIIEETSIIISKVYKLHEELKKAKIEKEKTKSEIEKLETQIEEYQRKITLIQMKPELINLSLLDEKIKELDRNVKHSLRHLQKPFRKMQQLTQNTKEKTFLINVQKLDEYLSKPFIALATEEEGYPILKNILQATSLAIEQNKLKLKAARSRKAREDIAKLLNENSLLNLQLQCKETFAQLQKLQSSEVVLALRSEYLKLQESLNELLKRKEIENSRLTSQRIEYDSKLKEITTQKIEIEKNIQNTLGKNIKIIL